MSERWRVGDGNGNDLDCIFNVFTGERIGYATAQNVAEEERRARLMAAAPAMLEALKTLIADANNLPNKAAIAMARDVLLDAAAKLEEIKLNDHD